MEFEWDANKAKYNLRKHGISFEEASSVFQDEFAAYYYDPDHSTHENRFLTIGSSSEGQLLHVAFVDRGRRIRIISARRPTKREKKLYEEETR